MGTWAFIFDVLSSRELWVLLGIDIEEYYSTEVGGYLRVKRSVYPLADVFEDLSKHAGFKFMGVRDDVSIDDIKYRVEDVFGKGRDLFVMYPVYLPDDVDTVIKFLQDYSRADTLLYSKLVFPADLYLCLEEIASRFNHVFSREFKPEESAVKRVDVYEGDNIVLYMAHHYQHEFLRSRYLCVYSSVFCYDITYSTLYLWNGLTVPNWLRW